MEFNIDNLMRSPDASSAPPLPNLKKDLSSDEDFITTSNEKNVNTAY